MQHVVLGVGLAWLVSAPTAFPGRRVRLGAGPAAGDAELHPRLPHDRRAFGVAGPVQDQWRDWFGRDAWFPDVESLPGRDHHVHPVLYPYVYLLARAALRDQAAGAYLAARSLGAGPAEPTRRVVLPLVATRRSRPAPRW